MNFSLRQRGLLAQIAALLVLTVVFSAILTALRLPAALLLAAIAGGATIAALEGKVQVPNVAFLFTQALIGGMIGKVLTFSMLRQIFSNGPVVFGAAFSVILASALIGWVLSRGKLFRDSTPIWGLLPGAASAMTMMAEAYGADMRLVAFMQYARVLVVALTASLFARVFAPDAFSSAANPLNASGAVSLGGLAATCLMLAGAAAAGRALRFPAGPLLLPLIASAVAQGSGAMEVELPRALLAFGYAALGWSIGLRFSRDILLHALRALPAVLVAILGLLTLCAALALALAHIAHVDLMTAFLAMSPGGVDTVAIIAVSAHLDLSFIMAVQTVRLLLVILIGPGLARLIADRTAPATSAGRAAKNSPQDGRN